MSQSLFVSNSPVVETKNKPVNSEYVSLGEEDFYKISNYDQMSPFFMTIVSNSDHWLFISSTGGLTAGRKNENYSLFPYYTDDKISDSFETTGSKTILRIEQGDKKYLWEPFSERYQKLYSIKRNILKSISGNKVVFEEINEDLNLKFQYSWQFSDKYGFVRKSTIKNFGKEKSHVDLLDGLQNILPYGVNSGLQNERSNLVNAYKKNELEPDTGLGLILLSAIIVDRAEPSEALKATTVWSAGMEADHYLLSSLQLDNFRSGNEIRTESNVKAQPGAYFLNKKVELKSSEVLTWQIVSELNQDSTAVNNLNSDLKNNKKGLLEDLEKDIIDGTFKLRQLVGAADGIQISDDKLIDGRHYMNVLFNIMRGGIFDEGYNIDTADFSIYVKTVNKDIYQNQKDFLSELPDKIAYQELLELSKKSEDSDLIRIAYDYLPLTFSRRHGDPSRPWNKFSIETRKEDGSKNLDYQGNWRDIFQNWEALSLSYPQFINSMISKFVNASTMDGYNPYRIMRDGIDWEVIEPDDPWSYIGYWGDHQIIYLQKLLEISYQHSKSELEALLEQGNFVYANVPYIIKSYDEILDDPKDTIVFDQRKEEQVEERVRKMGSDGKMVLNSEGKLVKATLSEKLLLTLLAKLSNFVPEGGIWLNTQRPEWNDANNALVGNGISMVTLYYMRRYVNFCIELFSNAEKSEFSFSEPISDLLNQIFNCLKENAPLLKDFINDKDRKAIMDKLGKAGEAYRESAYAAFEGSDNNTLEKSYLIDFFKISLEYIEHSIRANKRNDGLYHSYNLLELNTEKASVSYLYEMLEGQVAVLTSGYLGAEESVDLLEHLEKSKIYRKDQYSYLLYPDRELPRFLNKNNIPEKFIENSKLAQKLIRDGEESFLTCDKNGTCHFNGNFTNSNGLKEGLENLENKGYQELVKKESHAYLEVFEKMFNHKAFTGRSGTFFGYEGLGSIYWHMVSKLLLAVQENIDNAMDSDDKGLEQLKKYYYKVREGIGVHKSPELYGAFPTDPYSHTPANKGAQQPGMTGQVKEDILNRWAELGVKVRNGKIKFQPSFLNSEEFLSENSEFKYFDVEGQSQSIKLDSGELAFTYCQVPVVYSSKKGSNSISILTKDNEGISINGLELDLKLSSEIFNRSSYIKQIKVNPKV